MKRSNLLLITTILLAYSTYPPETWAQETDNIIRLGPGVTSPRLTYKIEPQYTQAALDGRIQGTVLLQIVIDDTGVPRDVTVLSPLGFGLDERAVACVTQWRFKPATKDGRSVRIRAEVEVNFRLLGMSFDQKAEERRTRFNAIILRLQAQEDRRPTDRDVVAMKQLAKHRLPGAEYVIGIWEMNGESMAKDPAAGLANIQKAADKNYGPALFFIGNAQLKGTVLPKNPAKGLSLIQDAAVLGSKEAQFTLGEMYENGDGVDSDLDRAKRYFRLCAASGTPECQYRLGRLLLLSPRHSEEDQAQAVAWLELAKDHLSAARAIAESEAGKLTPEQANWVARIKSQLEPMP